MIQPKEKSNKEQKCNPFTNLDGTKMRVDVMD